MASHALWKACEGQPARNKRSVIARIVKWSSMLQEEFGQECCANHVKLCVSFQHYTAYVKYYLVMLAAKDAMSADYTLLLCTDT